jgi:RES domain
MGGFRYVVSLLRSLTRFARARRLHWHGHRRYVTDVPHPTPTTQGSIVTVLREYRKMYRFVREPWVRLHANPSNELTPSFNPTLQQSSDEGGRFDAVDRPQGHWLFDPYSYLYAGVAFKAAFYEMFGDETRAANALREPPELDASRWLEIIHTSERVEVADVANGWPGCSVPALINSSMDYEACRNWCSWLRLERRSLEGLRYVAPRAVRPCLVFFGEHPLAHANPRPPGDPALPGTSGCEGKLWVREAYRITDSKVRRLMRGVGIKSATFVVVN